MNDSQNNGVLCVGAPCAGYWVRGAVWYCRCGAYDPADCITETAIDCFDERTQGYPNRASQYD